MKIFVSVFLVGLMIAGTAQAQSKISIEQLAAYNKPDRDKILYAGAKQREKSPGIRR